MTLHTLSKVASMLKRAALAALVVPCAVALADELPKPVQVFYNPFPEADVLEALTQIEGDYNYVASGVNYTPSEPVYSYTYITVYADNTVIYYDQWENGYEADISKPSSLYSSSNVLGTQIWGDGDLSNGCAPGTTDDRLRTGTIIKLESAITLKKVGTELYYDGRDKWAASKPCAASRAVWAENSKTLLASANEMFDTTYFGTEFIAPVGTDTANQHELFEYTGFSIMAGENGATIQYSLDGKTVTKTVTLAEGESYFVNNGVKQGGYVKATKGDVQVELITGDIYDGFEARFFKLLPKNMWANSYTCPVAAPKSITTKSGSKSTTTSCGSAIWIYNPGTKALTVTYKYRGSSSMSTKTVSVPAGQAVPIVPGEKSDDTTWTAYTGVESGTYLTADAPFYALSTFDAIGTDKSTWNSTKKSATLGVNRTWDWGFALVADSALSSQVLVGLGLGCDPVTTKTAENGAPIWITAPYLGSGFDGNPIKEGFSDKTTVYVRYANSTSTKKDPNGAIYDATYELHPLEILKIYDEATTNLKNGQTGMTIWTTDGTRLAAAWGEDPKVATSGEPGIDMGTGIPPMPDIRVHKAVALSEDCDEDGYVTCGDVLEYSISIFNSGRIALTDVLLRDDFSSYLTYNAGTLHFSGVDAEGNTTYADRLLDDSTWNAIASAEGVTLTQAMLKTDELPQIGPSGTWTFTYKATIGNRAVDYIPNLVYANNKYTTVSNAVSTAMRAKVGDYVWLDNNGNGIQDAGEPGLSGVTVSLVYEDGRAVLNDKNQPYSVKTDATGKYLFTGIRPGDYKVQFSVPEIYKPTAKDAGGDDTLDSDIGADGATAVFHLGGGQENLTLDAGFVIDGAPAIKIVKTAGSAADGDVLTVKLGSDVTYSYKVTNTGKAPLKDVVVTDDILGAIGTVSGIFMPGESAVLTKTIKADDSVVNVGTVTGTPCNEEGGPLQGVPSDPVTDSDDAEIVVTDSSCWIGDYVWVDANKNGVQDAGEYGVAGATVRLQLCTVKTTTTTTGKYPNKKTVTTVTTNFTDVATTTTDANGYYVFKGLESTVSSGSSITSYIVTFENPDSQLFGFTAKDAANDDAKDSDADPATGKCDPVSLAVSAHNMTIDCGLVLKDVASIQVVKTAGDAADGATLKVEKGNAVTYTYVVKNTGKTALVNVSVSDNKIGAIGTVEGVLLPGASATLTKTVAAVNADVTNVATATGTPSDSDGNPYTNDKVTDTDDAKVKVFTLPAKLGDYVWLDLNANGVQDAGEKPLAGVTVNLLDKDGAVVQTTATGADGKYLFDIAADALGTYRVQFVAPANFTYTAKGTGTATDSDAAKTGLTDALEITSGLDRRDIDCGLVFNGKASIDIVKTAGDAADGDTYMVEKGKTVTYAYKVTNTGACALRDVKVTDDKLGEIGTVSGVLLPGASATLTKTSAAINADVTNVGSTEGLPCSDDGAIDYSTTKVTDTDDAVVKVYELGSIDGLVWLDADKDGVRDADEDVLGGVAVKLVDKDGNTVATTTTANDGTYAFDNLKPGDYKVVVTKPADSEFTAKDQGGDDTKDSDVYKTSGATDVITLPSGGEKHNNDAGVVSTLKGAIDIVKTAGDAADGETLTVVAGSNVTFTITVRNTGTAILKDVKVADAKLNFTTNIASLAVGESKTFAVKGVVNENTVNVATATGTPTDANGKKTGEDVSDDDDAVVKTYLLGSIGDYAWIDVDGDGIQDAGEKGLAGVAVKLVDKDGKEVATDETDENGLYKFENLEPGEYRVVFPAVDDFKYAPKDQGGNDAKDSDASSNGSTATITVAGDGAYIETVDCGYVFDGKASVKIVKTAGDAADGEVLTVLSGSDVTYTVTVRNTGDYKLVDAVVTDELLDWTSESFTLGVGETKTFTVGPKATSANIDNVATVEGTPADDDGDPLTDKTVTDDDDAEVEVYELGGISGLVWIDANTNGVQDAEEAVVPGATVTLVDLEGNEIDTAETDEDGAYEFTGLEPGDYKVVVTKPADFEFTGKDVGDDDTVDSDVSATGATDKITVPSGVTKEHNDAGLVSTATAAVEIVKLAGDAADGDIYSVLTNTAFNYTISVKNVGATFLKDVVVKDDTLGWTNTVALLAPNAVTNFTVASTAAKALVNVADVAGTPANEQGETLSTTPVTDDDDAEITVYELGAISGLVWIDSNGDGIQGSEPKKSGVTVKLLDAEGNEAGTTTTDANGAYEFTGLEPGDYRVVVVAPEKTAFTKKDQGKDDTVDSDVSKEGSIDKVTVESGKTNEHNDAGLVSTATAAIEIVKVAGTAADGETFKVLKGSAFNYVVTVRNSGESYLANVTVTDDQLNWTANVALLAPGATTNFVIASTATRDLVNTAEVTGKPSDETGTVIDETSVTDSDDAKVEVYELGAISGLVWIDADKLGSYDSSEAVVPGVTVKLLDAEGNTIATTTTDGNGAYSFTGLEPGDYKVAVMKPADYAFTLQNVAADDIDSDVNVKTGVTDAITVESGKTSKHNDAGLVTTLKAAVDILKLAGDAADGEIYTVRTNADFNYTITVKNIGATFLKNVVVSDQKLNWTANVALLAPGATTNFVIASRTMVNVENVASVTGTPSDKDGRTVDSTPVTDEDNALVEVFYPVNVGDYTWIDVNHNGVQEAGEKPLAGVTVKLLDAEGKVLRTTKTDANGKYLFKEVDIGTYKVAFEDVADYFFTYKGRNLDTVNSDADETTGVTDAFTLVSGTDNLNLDCGYVWNGGASVEIVKTAGDAADGETYSVEKGSSVVYTYTVRNTGSVNLVNVTVTDNKLAGQSATIEGILKPGESKSVTLTAAQIDSNVTNVGTVVATPADEDGDPLTTSTVTDTDDAVVEVFTRGSIGDFAWIDANKNGLQDPGEVGLGGVAVKLVGADGKIVATTNTADNGSYLFTDVLPGDYTVVFGKVEAFDFAEANVGGNDAVDSDADAKGVTGTVTLGSGESITTVDAGYVYDGSKSSVQIVKTAADVAGDNYADDGDVLNVKSSTLVTYTYTVVNTGSTGLKDLAVTDDKLGLIGSIGYLAPGATNVLTSAAAIAEDTVNVGTVVGTPCDDTDLHNALTTDTVTDSDDAKVEVYEYGKIGDKAWIDVNGNGIQDAGEPGLKGVVVTLADADGNEIATAVTDDIGGYVFDNLVPGDYKVSFAEPTNFVFTVANAGDDEEDSDATGAPINVTVESGDYNDTVDAGFVIADGSAWIQVVKTAGDAADGDIYSVAKGSPVTYTYVITNTSAFAITDISVNDDKLGTVAYYVAPLKPGQGVVLQKTAAKIDVDTTNVVTVAGYPALESNPSQRISNTPVTDADDAIVEVYERASVGDYVWIDVDGDGIQDAGEPAVEGAAVNLLDEDGEVVDTATTDANGAWSIDDVEPGKYTVEVVLPADVADVYEFTKQDAGENDAEDSDVDASGKTAEFELGAGETNNDMDAGVVLRNGVAAIDIVKVAGDAADGETLKVNVGDTVEYTVVTRNTGKVALTDVVVTDETLGVEWNLGTLLVGEARTNTVSAVIDADVVNVAVADGVPSDDDGTPISDKHVTDDDDAKVTATPLTATIGDYVWNDANGNGVQDEGEIGIYNVTVELYDADTNFIARTTTDAKGCYVFTDVQEGDYILRFVVDGTSWTPTGKYAGDSAATDSNADENGWTEVFTVVGGEDNLTLDCGLVGGVPPGICDLIAVANKFNAFVRGNLLATGGDSEGNLLVGGNAWVYDGFSVGHIGPGYGRTREIAEEGTDTFVVGGDLSEGARPDMNGNIVFGGTYTNRLVVTMDVNSVEYTNSLGEVEYIVWTNWMGMADYRAYDLRHVNPVTLNDEFNVPEDGSGTTLDEIAAELEQFSEIVGTLPDTQGVSYWQDVGVWGNETHDMITLTGTDTFRNVFSITNETLHNANIAIVVPEGSKVVVNIYGSDINIEDVSVNGANHPDRGVDYTKLLFNFVNATNLVSKWTQFGSVIAPNVKLATLDGGTSINGFGYFGGNVDLLGGSEFHDYVFKAFDCSASDVVTMRPSIDVVVTAGGAGDGEVLNVVKGTPVVLSATISNTSAYTLTNVTLDVFGSPRFVDSLAPGKSLTYGQTITPEESGSSVWTVAASAYSIGSAPFEGVAISDADSATIYAAGSEAEYNAIIAAKEAEKSKGRYVELPDFGIVNAVLIGETGRKPSITGEVFTVSMTITNYGNVAMAPGRVSAYIIGGDGTNEVNYLAGSVRLMLKSVPGVIPANGSVTVTLPAMKTPLEGGFYMVRLVVDDGNEIVELSEGNNHWLDSARLSPILLNISVINEGVLLNWNSFAGEGYEIYGGTNLVDWVLQPVEGKSFVEATPPECNVLFEFGSTEAKFFKIYADLVENLAKPE